MTVQIHLTHSHHSSLLVNPLDGIQYLNKADEWKFLLVSQYGCVHKVKINTNNLYEISLTALLFSTYEIS